MIERRSELTECRRVDVFFGFGISPVPAQQASRRVTGIPQKQTLHLLTDLGYRAQRTTDEKRNRHRQDMERLAAIPDSRVLCLVTGRLPDRADPVHYPISNAPWPDGLVIASFDPYPAALTDDESRLYTARTTALYSLAERATARGVTVSFVETALAPGMVDSTTPFSPVMK